MTRLAGAATAATDAGARLRLGAAGRGLGRHRQLRAAVRAVRELGFCVRRSVAGGAGGRRESRHAWWHAELDARAGTVRGRRGNRLRFVVVRAWGRPGRRTAGPRRLGGIDGTGLRRGAQPAPGAIRGSRRRRSPPPAWVRCAPGWLWATPAICRRSPSVWRRLSLRQASCSCCCSDRSTRDHARLAAVPACSIVRCQPGPRARGAIRGNGRRSSPDWRCCR